MSCSRDANDQDRLAYAVLSSKSLECDELYAEKMDEKVLKHIYTPIEHHARNVAAACDVFLVRFHK